MHSSAVTTLEVGCAGMSPLTPMARPSCYSAYCPWVRDERTGQTIESSGTEAIDGLLRWCSVSRCREISRPLSRTESLCRIHDGELCVRLMVAMETTAHKPKLKWRQTVSRRGHMSAAGSCLKVPPPPAAKRLQKSLISICLGPAKETALFSLRC